MAHRRQKNTNDGNAGVRQMAHQRRWNESRMPHNLAQAPRARRKGVHLHRSPNDRERHSQPISAAKIATNVSNVSHVMGRVSRLR
jgi:hypothetical protein